MRRLVRRRIATGRQVCEPSVPRHYRIPVDAPRRPAPRTILVGPISPRPQAKEEQRLREYAGVYEVSDSFRAGKEQVKLGIRPEAETLGLTLQDLGRQVRQAFYGEEAQHIQRGRDDIRVVVRYPRDERRSLGDLENMRIRTPAGGEVPISQVAVV